MDKPSEQQLAQEIETAAPGSDVTVGEIQAPGEPPVTEVVVHEAPKDELEGMLAAQLIASHHAAMECYRRAMVSEQTFEGRHENLRQATKLSRASAALLEALNRHRGKGQQKVTVEHVHVHAGGQAIVGTVERPTPIGSTKSEDHDARQLTHAHQPAMRSPNAEREFVPSTGDAEWPLPDARRTVSRSAKGK